MEKSKGLNPPEVAAIAALAVLAFAAFGWAAGFGSINLDDPAALANNQLISEIPIRASQVAAALTYVGPLNLWHPVTWWSHQLDTVVFGFPAWGARHAVNVVLHAGTVALLYLFLFQITRSRPGAFFAAALFAIHPQRVETVAWLTSRKELLAGFFVLLACLCWVQWRRSGIVWHWWASLLAFGAALLSHPVSVMFAAVLPFLDRCCFSPDSEARPGFLRREYLAFYAAAGLVALATLGIHRESGLSGLETTHGMGDRAGRIALSAWHYASTAFWPRQQRLFEIPPEDPGRLKIMALGGIVVLAGVVFAIRRFLEEDWHVPLLGAAWVLLFLLPVSGLVAMSPYLGADRYTYLPHMGAALLLAWFWPKETMGRWIAGAAAVAAAVILLGLSERRLANWKSSETLFRAEVAASPRSKIAALHLGVAFLDAGRPAEALVWFERSLAIDPKFDLALHNAALARRQMEKPAEAR